MAKKLNAKLSAQLYTLRDFCKTAEDFAKTMKRVRKIGYRHVQISGIGPIPACEVRAILDDTGLTAIGAHIGLNDFRENLPSVIERCHTWGTEYVAIPWMPASQITSGAGWKAHAKEFSKYGKLLQKEGITVQYHNHCFEFQKYKLGTKLMTGLEILYRESDAKYLQAEIDTHWVARGGGNPATWIRGMKGRTDQVHFKDMVILNDQPVMAEIGQGNLEWDAIIAACAEAGVKDVIVEQDICPITNDPFKSLEISYKFLKAKGLK